MSRAENQARTFLRLLSQLRPHWQCDATLPARIQSLLTRRREFGARDRRLYRELIYTTLRHLPWIEPFLDSQPEEAVRRAAWLAAETPATHAFRASFAFGEPPTGDKAGLLPGWFRPHCAEIFSGAELDAQLRRAPVWLRLQTDEPALVLEEFAQCNWHWRRSSLLSNAIEFLSEADVTKTNSWAEGRLEVQDLGSQMILESIGIEPGGRWLDACAGAGGKTLQLARLLGSAGIIDAHDVRPAALAELRARARRGRCDLIDDTSPDAVGRRVEEGRLSNDAACAPIRVFTAAPAGRYDGVLVDAPCSGSGTWRRAPHLKWFTTDAQISRAAEIQRALLDQYSLHVKPGGRLVYATCSLSSRENEDVVAAFLAGHGEFHLEPFARTFGAIARGAGLLILPAQHDTDGFFAASLRRTSAGAGRCAPPRADSYVG